MITKAIYYEKLPELRAKKEALLEFANYAEWVWGKIPLGPKSQKNVN